MTKSKRRITAEEAKPEWMFEGFDPMPPFNVAKMVDHLITEHGEGAADWAQTMARWARSLRRPESAEDYEMVREKILQRQGKA